MAIGWRRFRRQWNAGCLRQRAALDSSFGSVGEIWTGFFRATVSGRRKDPGIGPIRETPSGELTGTQPRAATCIPLHAGTQLPAKSHPSPPGSVFGADGIPADAVSAQQ